MTDHVSRRAILLVTALTIGFCFLTPTNAHTRNKSSSKVYSLGHFRLTFEKTVKLWLRNHIYKVEFSRSGEKLFEAQSCLSVPEVKFMHSVPSKGCRSMLTMLFSGGAHCCFTAILCSVCGPEETAVVLDLLDGSELKLSDVDGDGTKEISFPDMQFGYYDPEIANLDLPFATSPEMYRLLVFDKNRWRPDKPGEFKKHYSELMLRSKSKAEMELSSKGRQHKEPSEDENAAAFAIEAAYYALMAGEEESSSRELLQNLLPSRWQQAREKVLSDIKEKVQELNPIIEQVMSKDSGSGR
ncbi:MAG: hypothetical protein AB2L11_13090 [Syntrophobacteraceae bacterium]